MLIYVAKRIFYMIIAFIVVSLVTFFLMKAAPGSFLALNTMVGGVNAAAEGMGVTPELMQSLIQTYHLNDPWYVQYWFYVWGFLTLHMGYSVEFPTIPTLDIFKQAFPVSFAVAIIGVGVGVVVSVITGVFSAMRANTWVDSTTMLVAISGTAIPAYVIAVFLALVFGVWFRILPVIGFKGPQYYVLPVLSLAIPMIGSVSRYMRNSLIEALNSEYVVTVYAKGGGLKQVVFGHALRNSLLPLVTVVGPHVAGLMMGALYIEQIFGLPGLGQYFANAAARRDYPLIMDSTLIYAVVIMLMNLLVDLTYGLLDPRIRKAGYGQGR